MTTDPETLLSLVQEINAIADDLRRPDSAIKRYIAKSNAALMEAIRKLPTPMPIVRPPEGDSMPTAPTLDRSPRVHLLYNMNPITAPSSTEEARRPINDYLCGYLRWRLDRLAHARRIAMSAAVLEGFAHVPVEVTCSMCWETITALTRSMGRFAQALRLREPRP